MNIKSGPKIEERAQLQWETWKKYIILDKLFQVLLYITSGNWWINLLWGRNMLSGSTAKSGWDGSTLPIARSAWGALQQSQNITFKNRFLIRNSCRTKVLKKRSDQTFPELNWNLHKPALECLHWRQFSPILSRECAPKKGSKLTRVAFKINTPVRNNK